ncbi:quinone oxidoreductase [Punctularia strigosozonata HHB-11173 SS5]|uniref:quinone oxidoreductase n=1 Tax=Punctularia strigosozonata (strain HHB-11173) TaxID=741275 RepID=UPI0004416E1A|nr:quinone oxidoreductase [Punctularia strigosozonata HHB-11173 SS5]EIN12492.1 quinone oxidoreductase [Punctularia strigosozonata HHB-11173 SS5]
MAQNQMRAVLVRDGKGPIENLYLGDAPKPSPGPDQVLVKIRAFGLNRMDISQREGKYPVPPGASEILGVEFAGTVAAVGSDVDAWAVDDEVYGLASGGAYAEYIVLPATHVLKKPAHLNWVEAASLPENFLTAFQALILIGGLQKGEHVLIHAGASGVGVAAAQLARLYGAKTITATASTSEKLSWLLSLPAGPTHAVNYKTQDFAEEVKKVTDGHGADVVIDFVGQSHWARNIDALAVDGRMTMLALMSGAEVPKANLMPILYKRLRIQGSTLRARSVEYQAELIRRFQTEVSDKITGEKGDGQIRTYIYHVYGWHDIQKAHACMQGNSNSGKIICEVV